MANAPGDPFGIAAAMGNVPYNVDQDAFNLPQLKQTQDVDNTNSFNALGYAHANSPFRSQQLGLAQMLTQQAQGNGPNPWAQQLANSTQANIGNAYALSQAQPNNAGASRGLANSAFMANQQAGGQAATLQAQQAIAAQQQLGGVLAQGRGADTSQFQAANQAALGWGGQQLNANEAQMNANIAKQQMAYQAHQAQVQANQQVYAGFLSSLSSLGGGLSSMSGGSKAAANFGGGGGGSNFNSGTGTFNGFDSGTMGGYDSAAASGISGFFRGGQVPSASRMCTGGSCGNAYMHGGAVPGRAPVAGNSPKNDTVSAKLSPGEVVLPRSVTQSKNAPALAKEFMAAVLKKGTKKPGKKD